MSARGEPIDLDVDDQSIRASDDGDEDEVTSIHDEDEEDLEESTPAKPGISKLQAKIAEIDTKYSSLHAKEWLVAKNPAALGTVGQIVTSNMTVLQIGQDRLNAKMDALLDHLVAGTKATKNKGSKRNTPKAKKTTPSARKSASAAEKTASSVQQTASGGLIGGTASADREAPLSAQEREELAAEYVAHSGAGPDKARGMTISDAEKAEVSDAINMHKDWLLSILRDFLYNPQHRNLIARSAYTMVMAMRFKNHLVEKATTKDFAGPVVDPRVTDYQEMQDAIFEEFYLQLCAIARADDEPKATPAKKTSKSKASPKSGVKTPSVRSASGASSGDELATANALFSPEVSPAKPKDNKRKRPSEDGQGGNTMGMAPKPPAKKPATSSTRGGRGRGRSM